MLYVPTQLLYRENRYSCKINTLLCLLLISKQALSQIIDNVVWEHTLSLWRHPIHSSRRFEVAKLTKRSTISLGLGLSQLMDSSHTNRLAMLLLPMYHYMWHLSECCSKTSVEQLNHRYVLLFYFVLAPIKFWSIHISSIGGRMYKTKQ